MIKKIYNTLLVLNFINVFYIIIICIKFIIDKDIAIDYINYRTVNWFLISLLFELIYLVLNFKKQISKRKIIFLLLIFIIQTAIMFCIPVYLEDVGITCAMPRKWNVYGF